MTSSSASSVKLSQDSLFYPLPLTNASIENVIRIENTLPPGDPEHREKNIISFKVLSAVRYRYSVRPAIGFIAPEQHVTVRFILDPDAIRRCKDPKDRVLPTKETKDSIFIDFAVVSHYDYGAACVKDFLEKGKGEEGASLFWKQHGPVQGDTAGENDARRRLRCVYDSKDQVPESLVMQLKQEASRSKAAAAAAGATAATAPLVAPEVPSTRPPPTPGSSTQRGHKPPEGGPPRRASLAVSPPRPSPGKPAASPPLAGGLQARLGLHKPTSSPDRDKNKESGSGKEEAVSKSSLKAIFRYRVPYAACAVILLLTFLCALYDQHNIIIWLLGK